MASVALAIEQAASRSEKLWWDSHKKLWDDFEELSSLSEENVAPDRLVQKQNEMEQRLHRQRHWLLNMLLCFKPPSSVSKDALNSPKIVVGSSTFDVTPKLKSAAIQISKYLDLDEIQSFCLLRKVLDEEESDVSSLEESWLIQNVTIAYFIDRQCLLKCTRCLLTFSSGDGALSKLVKDFIQIGLENKILENVKTILSSTQPHRWDPVYAKSWADEIVLEQALLMDILFNAYDSSLCTSTGSKWKELLQTFQELVFDVRSGERLAVTPEAEKLVGLVRNQAVLILIVALDLRLLLNLVQGGIPFSQGGHGFSVTELQELDSIISNLDLSTAPEYAPLLLALATFLCLVAALPDQAMIMDVEHALYAQQGFKNGAFGLLLNMLHSEPFKHSDFQITGYKGAIKTLTSACLAAYDLASQADRNVHDQLVEIISEAYNGQEVLCTEFWDRDNPVDGPIRSLLFSLRKDFPYKMRGLLRLLKSLCWGAWPAQCVFDFLSKAFPVTFLYHPSDSEVYGSKVHISAAIQIPNCSGLYIPAGAAGNIIGHYQNGVALVRWECDHSGLVILLSYMTRWLTETNEELVAIVALLNQMLSSNMDVSHSVLDLEKTAAVTIPRMDGRMDKLLSLDVIGIVCSVIRNLTGTSGDFKTIAESINLLQKFVHCCPGRTMADFEKTGVIGTARDQHLQMKYSKLEQSAGRYFMTSSVLDIARSFLEKGVRMEPLASFVLHTTQNLLVNHGNWKYKERHERWVLSTKIFQMLRVVLGGRLWYSDNLKRTVFDSISKDPIIHGVLVYILTINSQSLEELYHNRRFSMVEISSLLQAVCAALELVDLMLFHVFDERDPKDSATISIFCQSLFQNPSSSTSLVSVIASYLGFNRDNELQVLALRVLGRLCEIGQKAKPQSINIGSYLSSAEARKRLRKTFENILSEDNVFEEPLLFDAALMFIDTVVKSQPPMAELLLFPWDSEGDSVPATPSTEVLDALWKLLSIIPFKRSKRHLEMLSSVLLLLSSLWQGGSEYLNALQVLRRFEGFWDTITSSVTKTAVPTHHDVPSQEESLIGDLCYRCQASVYQIMVHDIFIQDRLNDAKNNAFPADDPGPRKKMIEWSTSGQVTAILQSYGTSWFREDFILKFKAAARAFVVGLLVKLLSGDVKGMDVSLVKRISEFSSQLMQHKSFKEVSSQYANRGYRFDESLELLVMTDLYYNLVGELEGRHISSSPFSELSTFVAQIELDLALVPVNFPHDSQALRCALGLSYDRQAVPIKVTEKVLYDADIATGTTRLGNSQLLAIDALADLLKVFSIRRRADTTTCGDFWNTNTLLSSTEEICSGLERVAEEAKSSRLLYLPKFLASQSKLFFVITWQLAHHSEDRQRLAWTLSRAIGTCFDCIKDAKILEYGTMRNLFGCLLLSLEATTPSNTADEGVHFLRTLCEMAKEENLSCFSLAAINVIIRGYIESSTWLPIIQEHFPAKAVVARMAGADVQDENTCGVVLRLCLYLSRFKGAAEMLFGADLLHYIVIVREPCGEATKGGPFSTSPTASQPSPWALGVAIIASLLRTLGENEGHRRYILESAVNYIKMEKQRILSVLSAPNLQHGSQNRSSSMQQRLQTTLGSLQETYYVSALLCELVRHRVETLHIVQDDLVEVRERVVHLLAYIAREGLVRAAAITQGVSCPPLQRQEMLAHGRPSSIGSNSAWFLICARGASVKNRQAASEIVPTTTSAPQSQYSDSIAVQVYKIVSLLLRFLATQARQAVQDMEQGRSKGFPELPAPEVLHALQDQAMTVVSEIARSKEGKSLAPQVLDTCCLLLSILEKSLYLEVCISRIYGISPVSLRVDDFVREYRALLSAAKAYSVLDSSLASLKEVAAFVYNGLLKLTPET